ncbi:MAG: BBE domain-containing protein, partial [Chloroflexota bacterium]
TDPPVPEFNATIEFYAGKMNRIDPASTAYPHRDARYQLLSIGVWDDPADDEIARRAARDLYGATEQYGTHKTFLNFNSMEKEDRTSRMHVTFGENWGRLVAVKRQYDPTNFFRQNNNIDPDEAGA